MLLKEFIDEYIVWGELCNETITDIGQDGHVRSEEQLNNLGIILRFMNRGIDYFNNEFFMNIEKITQNYIPLPFTFTPQATENYTHPISGDVSVIRVDRTLVHVADKNGHLITKSSTPDDRIYAYEDHNDGVTLDKGKYAGDVKGLFPIEFTYVRSYQPLRVTDMDTALNVPRVLLEALAAYVCLKVGVKMSTGDSGNIRVFKAIYDQAMIKARSRMPTPQLFTKLDGVELRGFV